MRKSRVASTVESFRPDVPTIFGKSVATKDEVSCSANVYLHGELEGSVELLQTPRKLTCGARYALWGEGGNRSQNVSQPWVSGHQSFLKPGPFVLEGSDTGYSQF
jgi:hypothetical protein